MNGLNLGDLLARRAKVSADLEASVEPDRDVRLTYRQLNAKANQCANMFSELGFKAGERVAFLLPNGHEFIASLYGAAKLGIVVVPLNTRLTGTELAYIVNNSGAKSIIYDASFASLLKAILNNPDHEVSFTHLIEVGGATSVDGAVSFETLIGSASEQNVLSDFGGDDNLFIMYTSGTTGAPKGVVHTHNSALWASLTWISVMDVREADRGWAPFPMFHVASLTLLIMAVQVPMTLVTTREFNPVSAWDVLELERVNIGGGVPAMLNFMRQAPGFTTAKIDDLRFMIGAAAPMPVELIETYSRRNVDVVQAYGLTESGGGGCSLASAYSISKVGSIGKPMLYTEVKIVHPDGTVIAPGENGEILIRGPHVMKEYWNNPEATASTLVDGWLHTGDVGTIDEDGFIFIRDRLKDMIISGGENIYPAEVENILASHPGVLEAAVIGQPSEKWGESPLAVIVRKDDSATAQSLLDYCQARLSRYKQPKRFVFIESLPRNASGKILKKELRKQFPGPADQ
ncbi:long-chain fatty acid--CoA ligase [Pseudomaricurvus alcaniphilus]|uniref:class I adenylate-forming enzyme family protein n=1 Tax=Pseudomaricurvus alcaniphilus TaxID=1166482 RepID=UPI00140725BD|nr:long-chain fatty acid--CoA ligase [Pseudomaricurvus alcaniphilus]NHN36541.1 long-chain fatty acid--CoA ligase [Pseudomaricurvus alcaniphilus]